MREKVLFLLCLMLGCFIFSQCEVEASLRRVKRGSSSETNGTKILENVTPLNGVNSVSNISCSNEDKDDTKTKVKKDVEPHFDKTAVDLTAAITKMRRLQTPVLRVARHFNKAQNVAAAVSEDKSCKLSLGKTARHQKKRNADKDLHNDMEKQAHIYLLSSEEFPGDIIDNQESHSIKKLHSRSHNPFDGYKDREKLIDLLTGETIVLSETPKHSGELRHNHESGKNARSHGKSNKSKRNSQNALKINNEMTGRHIKDDRDYFKHFNYATYKDSPVLKLTKMLIDLGEAENPSHIQNAELSLAPADRTAEIIYKPMNFDADEMGLGLTSSFTNELNPMFQEHALVPLTYNEFPLPLISNATPLKFLTNNIENTVANKDENDNEEYEMSCPVHFKRSVQDGSKDGVLEVCSCHLYRKKKKIV